MQGYDRDAASYGHQIRELLRADREAFYSGAIEILRTRDESRGSQFLISVLAAEKLLLPVLCEPTLTKEQALAMAREAIQAGVMVDVLLARHISEHAASIDDSGCLADLRRLMDILAEISNGVRIVPYLMALARSTNPAVQSKAVLMIGRLSRNVKWVLNRLSDSDPRVRANAIEGLWEIDTEEARGVLRSAGHDGNNRVAGNALIALYRLVDGWAIPELLKMADHESRHFRATAAWIMGETGDPRFTRTLARMVGEANIAVRTRAFAALGRIRAATAQARRASERRVVARFQPSRRTGWRELRVDVASGDGHEQIVILPTQLILIEDGREVVNYSVDRRPTPPEMAIAFLFPRTAEPAGTPFRKGALNALAWKRPSDLWSVAPYIPAVRPDLHASLAGQSIDFATVEASSLERISPPFTCDPEVARTALEKVPAEVDCSNLWSTIRRSVQLERGPTRGKRHLVVYSQSEAGPLGGYAELVSATLASRTSVHAISLVANPSLEGLAQKTQGTFQIAASEDEIAVLVEQTCLSLLARYTVRYQCVCPEAQELRIVVNTPSGWGEDTIPIPPLAARSG